MDTETAIQEIEQANESKADDPESFEVDKAGYKRILNVMAAVGGQKEVDALTERVVQDITAANERPSPEAVRRHAVDICERHAVDIPESSELSRLDATGSDTELGGDWF